MVNAGVAGQRVAHLVAVAGDDVDGPGRKTHLGGQLRHADQAQAGVFGGFDHAGVAGGQSAAHTAPKNLHRVVPRNHMARHAMWLAPGQHAVAVLVGQGLAVQLVAGPGIKLEIPRQRHGVSGGLFGRLTAVALLQGGQLGRVFGHFARQGHQQTTAFHTREPTPRSVESRPCRLNRLVDVGRLAARNLIEHLPVRWINHVEGLPGQGGRRLVGDEVVLHAAIVGSGAALEITQETGHGLAPLGGSWAHATVGRAGGRAVGWAKTAWISKAR